MTRPALSVIMAAWNAEDTIGEAMRSILDQTFADFEFIIVDDGSTDRTADIVRGACDDRIRLIRNRTNRGLAPSLNVGLAAARGRYIARIDADDSCRPERLAVQHRFLGDHPAVGLVGTAFDMMDAASRVFDRRTRHGGDEYVQRELLSWNPVAAGSVMMRAEVLRALRGYCEAFPTAEDYDLWLRIGEVARLHILPDVLYTWRVSRTSMTHGDRATQLRFCRRARALAWRRRTQGRDPLGRTLDLRPGEGPARRLLAEHAVVWGREALRQHRRREAAALLMRAAALDPFGARLRRAVWRMPTALLRSP